MLPLAPGTPGISRPILIDGVELSYMPSEADLVPESSAVILKMMDGRKRVFEDRPYFDGVANKAEPIEFSIPYDALKGDNLTKMQLIYARGGNHLLTVWRMSPAIYTCLSGVQTYYIPFGRRCAGWLYSGLALSGGGSSGIVVSSSTFPATATLNDVALDVTYEIGPTLIDPGAGGIVIARDPVTSGEKEGYVPMLLGDDVVTEDELIVWSCWTHEVSLRSAPISIQGRQESHAYVFVEV